jgi:hypothetical protein
MFQFGPPPFGKAEFRLRFSNERLGPFRIPETDAAEPAMELKLNGRLVPARGLIGQPPPGVRIEFKFRWSPHVGLLEIAQRERHVFPLVDFLFLGPAAPGLPRAISRRVRCTGMVIEAVEPIGDRNNRLSGWMYVRMAKKEESPALPEVQETGGGSE